MTEQDKQWLARHGFEWHENLSQLTGNPSYIKAPSTPDSVIVICCTRHEVSWVFCIIVEYNGTQYKYAQETLALTDSFLEHFVWRWNTNELPKMLVQCNSMYTIPEESKD